MPRLQPPTAPPQTGGPSPYEQPGTAGEVTEDPTERQEGAFSAPAPTIADPTELLFHARDIVAAGAQLADGRVAVDTETSGLYPDDGARISAVSVAWADPVGQWRYENGPIPGLTVEYDEATSQHLVSVAFPVDQGVAGKPEDNGQGTLWPEANNLTRQQWLDLVRLVRLFGVGNGLVMHNAKFDIGMFRAGCRRWTDPGSRVDLLDYVTWDTQTVNTLMWPLEAASLKPTCSRLFGEESADEQTLVKKYLHAHKLPTGRWDLIPWDVIGPYADKDAQLTLRLYHRQIQEITDEQRSMASRRFAVGQILSKMERRGLPYARHESVAAAQEVRERAGALLATMPFGPNEAKKFFFDPTTSSTSKGTPCRGLTPYKVTEKGAPSLTAEVVDAMLRDGVPWAKEWSEYTGATKAASMWYEGYGNACGQDGRLRTCFRQNGTRSSRFSVERVNLQAIPHDYRLAGNAMLEGVPTPRQLIAKEVADRMPGWKLWELDLAQAELRVASMFAGETRMCTMIRNGEDLHSVTTKELFGIDEQDKKFKVMRGVGKRANFSLIFGAGGDTFRGMIAKETGIVFGEREANDLVRRWNALYPSFGVAIQHHSNQMFSRRKQTGTAWISYVNGERRWFQPGEDYHKAFNQRVQGNLAQYGIDWMIRSEALLQQRGLGVGSECAPGEAGLVMVIHDSQVMLLPSTEEGSDLARRCADLGRDLWADWFPQIPGDVDCKEW